MMEAQYHTQQFKNHHIVLLSASEISISVCVDVAHAVLVSLVHIVYRMAHDIREAAIRVIEKAHTTPPASKSPIELLIDCVQHHCLEALRMIEELENAAMHHQTTVETHYEVEAAAAKDFVGVSFPYTSVSSHVPIAQRIQQWKLSSPLKPIDCVIDIELDWNITDVPSARNFCSKVHHHAPSYAAMKEDTSRTILSALLSAIETIKFSLRHVTRGPNEAPPEEIAAAFAALEAHAHNVFSKYNCRFTCKSAPSTTTRSPANHAKALPLPPDGVTLSAAEADAAFKAAVQFARYSDVVRAIANLPSRVLSAVTSACLKNCQIGDEGAASLASILMQIPKLHDLELCYNSIGDAGASSIAASLKHVQQLQQLKISHNSIGAAGASFIAAALVHVPPLLELDISGNFLGDAGAASLGVAMAHLPLLLRLDVSGNAIGDLGASSIAAALTHVPRLQHLDLSVNSISKAGAADVAAALIHVPRLQHLHLSGNSICEAGATAIAAALTHVPQLQHLYLFGNSIGEAGVSSVAAGLAHLPQLQHLYLSGNSMGAVGVSAIAESLVHVPKLQDLYLSHNSIGETGAASIAAALVHVPRVQQLHLSFNAVGDAGAASISAALLHLPKLQRLYLSGNGIGEAGASAIADALKHVPELLDLDVTDNPIGDNGARLLLSATRTLGSRINVHGLNNFAI